MGPRLRSESIVLFAFESLCEDEREGSEVRVLIRIKDSIIPGLYYPKLFIIVYDF